MKDIAMGKTIIKDLQFINEQLDQVISTLELEEAEKISDAFNRVFDFALTTITMGYAQYKEDISDERLEEIAKIFIENDIGIDEVLETMIESNGYVGVGLVTFGSYLKDYVMSKIERKV
jgi:hypothetical protein|tara:strand:+ start:568 stop:924 length:357 start_codon:yes stop_codon:yes gene_type:complete